MQSERRRPGMYSFLGPKADRAHFLEFTTSKIGSQKNSPNGGLANKATRPQLCQAQDMQVVLKKDAVQVDYLKDCLTPAARLKETEKVATTKPY